MSEFWKKVAKWVDDQLTDFYLPVILPQAGLSNPRPYYKNFEDEKGVIVSADSAGPGTPIVVTLTNPMEEYDAYPSVPVSTVFASTAGFLRYDPVAKTVILNVWIKDFDDLSKSDAGLRPNRIVFGLLDPAEIENAAEDIVARLATIVLEESWTEEGHSGPFPDRDTLANALVQRYMAGTASIFVRAGEPIGRASIQNDGTARFTLQTLFDSLDAPPVIVPADDFIDHSQSGLRVAKYFGHPLVEAISGAITVRFLSRFLIWDNVTFAYQPLANTNVTLLMSKDLPGSIEDLLPSLEVLTTITDSQGRIDETVLGLPRRALISFRYDTLNKTYGNRAYTENVRTDPHLARHYLDPNFVNTREYKAKYRIYPHYQDFVDDLVDNREKEAMEEDRGSASPTDHSLAGAIADAIPDFFEPNLVFSQNDRLSCIESFETFYRRDVLPPKAVTFNVLFEGDSWMNYPLAYDDIFGHLDRMFWARLKPGIFYNRIPLQHSGDRGDQMFRTAPGKIRQWNFTADFFADYPIDLIVCSAGGNDMAEPGIGASTDLKPFKSYVTNGLFNPSWAQTVLSASEMDTAKELMGRSFATLLKNHPWHAYLYGNPLLDEPTMRSTLDAKLAAIGNFPKAPPGLEDLTWLPAPLDTIVLGLALQPIGQGVIANFPDQITTGSPAEELLSEIFDMTLFDQRYAEVRQSWDILLQKADSLNVPVITHTYGYPLFNETPASYLGWGRSDISGPWFNNRFREANILDRRVQKACLKAILDRFRNEVLSGLQSYDVFDYVDVRNLNSHVDFWRDEMHLRATGYEKLAEQICDRVAAHPKLSHYFK